MTGITANPTILGGKPIIRGTKISVKFILESYMKGAKVMTAIRQIYENLPKTIITPVFLKNRSVEVIMLPLDETADKIKKPKSRRKHPIEEIIGAWEGEPLVRLDQGGFEK